MFTAVVSSPLPSTFDVPSAVADRPQCAPPIAACGPRGSLPESSERLPTATVAASSMDSNMDHLSAKRSQLFFFAYCDWRQQNFHIESQPASTNRSIPMRNMVLSPCSTL